MLRGSEDDYVFSKKKTAGLNFDNYEEFNYEVLQKEEHKIKKKVKLKQILRS